jgi:drug/metabolite transporter (DMT)-like permease
MPDTTSPFQTFARIVPALFVLLWSTGFIFTKLALPYAEPFTFCVIRLFSAAVLVGMVALIMRAPLPGASAIGHNVVSGLLVHAVYLSGVCVAIARGMPAGIAALIVGLQPILTSTLANRLLGERVKPQQWAGLVLGFVGVALVVQSRTSGEATLWGWFAICASLLGITLGTIYQKRFGGEVDFLSAMPVQYFSAAAFCAVGAFFLETGVVNWTPTFVFSVVWLVVVLSCGAIVLLYLMIRRSAATQVASLFYLTPPVTALMSYFLFGETLGLVPLAGMAVCAIGVFLVNWRIVNAA